MYERKRRVLQVPKYVAHVLGILLTETESNPSKVGQLVGKLTRSRNSHCASPVEIEMAQLRRQGLDGVGLETKIVVDDIVGSWWDLADGLGDQKEVKPSKQQRSHKINRNKY